MKHFLQDERDKAQRQKRGSGQVHDPLPDESTAAGGAQLANPTQPPPDAYFDREWALMVLERSLTLLSAEMDTAGKSATFQILKPWLTGTGEVSQGEAARQLNLSEGSVKVAIHRLRQRFREIVRQEIAATVASAEDVNDEVRYLVEVLSST